MATLLADPAAAAKDTAAPPEGPLPEPSAPAVPAAMRCPNCSAELAPGQDWCLQCGARAPEGGARGWRPAAAALAAALLLVLGAAGAGYAALSKKPRKASLVTATVAPATTTTATPPLASAPTPTPTPVPVTPAVTTPTVAPAVTPAPTATTPAVSTPTSTAGTGGQQTPSENTSSSEKSTPAAIVLDTDAASTYDPSAYPEGWFGDPSLAIDGDTATGWTAQVNPATAPALAEGLVIDMKTKHRLGSVKLTSTTPGMTVQIYGANGQEAPKTITDAAWTTLSGSLTVHKHTAKIGLRDPKKSYRFIVLWISHAPASSVGTAEAPGHISVNELELFPPR